VGGFTAMEMTLMGCVQSSSQQAHELEALNLALNLSRLHAMQPLHSLPSFIHSVHFMSRLLRLRVAVNAVPVPTPLRPFRHSAVRPCCFSSNSSSGYLRKFGSRTHSTMTSIFDFDLPATDSSVSSLAQYRGKKCYLVVNVASE
jgi:hypothetical protein